MKLILANLLLFMIPFRIVAQAASRFDVVIDEILADPSPSQGLPNSEFIELRNLSSKTFSLKGWKLGTSRTMATLSQESELKPDSLLIVCSNNAVPAYASWGTTLGVANFPTLNNEGDLVFLQSADGQIIHAIAYDLKWFQNEVKQAGGWSLEMIDPQFPCGGLSNWTASESSMGGSPGKINSVNGPNPDEDPPTLLKGFMADSARMVLHFDEALDIASASDPSHYAIDKDPIIVDSAVPLSPLFNSVCLFLKNPLKKDKIYQLEVSGLADCAGNTIIIQKIPMALCQPPDSLDLVINEILFDPLPGGTDYLELYNRGNKAIDLGELWLANRNGRGEISSLKRITEDTMPLFPGHYILVTEDTAEVLHQFPTWNQAVLLEVSALPSWPNDRGSVVVRDRGGRIIDQLNYDVKWQFALISDPEGVALERIDFDKPTQDPSNWHSASTPAGYGTPGYVNSVFRQDVSITGAISLYPSIISPDNDGHDDFATLEFRFTEPGNVCNVTIFNSNGTVVRRWVKNALCGTQGNFTWDGLDDQEHTLPVGIYIVYMELFNLKGKTKNYKQVITLARTW